MNVNTPLSIAGNVLVARNMLKSNVFVVKRNGYMLQSIGCSEIDMDGTLRIVDPDIELTVNAVNCTGNRLSVTYTGRGDALPILNVLK